MVSPTPGSASASWSGWLIPGIVVALLLAVGAFAFVMLNRTPEATTQLAAVTATPTATPMATPTATPVATATPAATATATPVVSADQPLPPATGNAGLALNAQGVVGASWLLGIAALALIPGARWFVARQRATAAQARNQR